MIPTMDGLFSFRRSKLHDLSTAVSASWSITILLCFKKGSPKRMFIQRSGASNALTGLEVHALFNEDKLRMT